MIKEISFRNAIFISIAFHLLLLMALSFESTNKRPAFTKESQNTPGAEKQILAATPQPEVVKAIAVDNREVMETVNRLKQERAQVHEKEVNRQKELNRQVEVAKQLRIKEQQQLAKLKEEANKIAIARKKQAEEEKKHLKELAEQKIVEAKRIKELQEQKDKLVKQQAVEEKKLAEMNKKKAQEKADLLKLEQASAEKARAEKAKADSEKKAQAMAAAKAAAAQNAQNQARIAGEVDKYRALILNAISKNWILPEHVDSGLTSQFRIRLAPDGTVMDLSLIRSSGDPLLDRSAQTAIYKASPLPVPTNAETFNLFRDINLTVRPEQVRG